MRSILIVDDEPDILESLALAWSFEAPEIQFRTAISGQAALAAIEAEPPDLVLTDFKMPDMDGLELLRRIRQKLPDLPCILMTAYPDPQLAIRSMAQGLADLVIAKPFDMPSLLTSMAAMLALRRK